MTEVFNSPVRLKLCSSKSHLIIHFFSFQGKVPKREVLPSGLETTMGTNYFGHVYLTHLLLSHLKRGGMRREDDDDSEM